MKIKKANCNFCGKEFQSGEEDFCSKRCMDLDGIAESIQKINYCVDLLKGRLDLKSDEKLNEVIKVLENNSFRIANNIMSVRSTFS
jgi:endogenous inhibitor of DNA gyrase (YacG/DUF329 family)